MAATTQRIWIGIAYAALAYGCASGGGNGGADSAEPGQDAAMYPCAAACDDGDPCTDDWCTQVAALPCAHVPRSEGAACAASCGAAGQCNAGKCQSLNCPPPKCKTAADCADENACTTDACDALTGCKYTPVECDDGDVCTTDWCIPATGCDYPSHDCEDGNPCTADTCDPASGCISVGTGGPCQDGSGCTTDDKCQDSKCVGTVLNCDDGDPCTVDSCSPAVGCSHQSCDDGSVCTNDVCEPTTGACTQTPIDCDDGIPCTLDSCWPSSGCNHDGVALACAGPIVVAAFSPTPLGTDPLAPTSPAPVPAPIFAPLSAPAVCLDSDPDGPPPAGWVDLGLPCGECPWSFQNGCQTYCGANGHCITYNASPCHEATTAPDSFCKQGTCVKPKPPESTGDGYFVGKPYSVATGLPGRCTHGFVVPTGWQYEPWILDFHPRNPVDDNPCTVDACDSCIGMTHVPAAGACRVAGACGQCVAGKCVAPTLPVVYDMGFASAWVSHPRGLPDGGVVAEVASYAGKDNSYGLARWNAAGKVTGQTWSPFPLRQADTTLPDGNFLANVDDSSIKPRFTALAFDATTLVPVLPALASDGGACCWDNAPVLLPDGTVAATQDELGIFSLKPSQGVGFGSLTLAARQGNVGVVVLSDAVSKQGKWFIPRDWGSPIAAVEFESSWVTALKGGAVGKTTVTGEFGGYIALPGNVTTPGAGPGSTALDGIGYTPAGTIAAWGRVRPPANTWPSIAAVWLSGDATAVLQTVIFDELPTVEGVLGWDSPGVGGVILPDGGVAAQVGRAVAWTDGTGKKIGYALLPSQYAGMRLFATWNDGTIGLVAPSGKRLAKIPWSWAKQACP